LIPSSVKPLTMQVGTPAAITGKGGPSVRSLGPFTVHRGYPVALHPLSASSTVQPSGQAKLWPSPCQPISRSDPALVTTRSSAGQLASTHGEGFGKQRNLRLSLSFLGFGTFDTAISLSLPLPRFRFVPLRGTLTRPKAPHRSREAGSSGRGIALA